MVDMLPASLPFGVLLVIVAVAATWWLLARRRVGLLVAALGLAVLAYATWWTVSSEPSQVRSTDWTLRIDE